MASVLTSDEVRAQYLTLMGPKLGPVFYALYNECAWLHVRWRQYVALFGTSAGRVQLVNTAAALFFRVVQDSLWEDTLLHLCRITDPPQTGTKSNLTLRQLPPLIEDVSLAGDTQLLIAEAEAKTGFARDWRNRRLAHTDFQLAMKQGANPLAPASRKDVAVALLAIEAALNRLELHYKNGELRFGLFPDPRDAEALLCVLRDGLNAEEQRQLRFREGRPNEDDLRPPPAV